MIFYFFRRKKKLKIHQTFLDDPCELYCTDSEDTLIVPWGDSAIDGTPCNIGTNDMCIAGICRVSQCLIKFSFFYT